TSRACGSGSRPAGATRKGAVMRRSFRAATVLAAAGFGLVGSTLQVASTASVAPADGQTTPAAKAVRGVCKGVPKCKVIGRFDVTGNGRKDQVGLVNR